MDAPQAGRKPRRMVGRRKKKASGASLSEEIEMLREAIRQVWAKTGPGEDLEVWTKTLDNLGKACQRLATVLKAESEMNVGESIGDIVLRLAPEALEEIKRMDQEDARKYQPPLPGLLAIVPERARTAPALTPAASPLAASPLAAAPSAAAPPGAVGVPKAGSAENATAGELNGDDEQA